ncbi:hypothetical protein P8452_23587 [Trifolium repens]|nr:hypothetical protein P8452_23587 [Trifolium repens]
MKNPALWNLGRILKVRDEEELSQLTEEDIVKRFREIAEEQNWTEEDYEDGRFSGLMPDHIDSDADSDTKEAIMAYCFDVGVLEDEDEGEDKDEVNGPPQQHKACSAQDSRNVISHFHFENLNGQREHLIFIPIYLSEGIKHIRDRNENKEVGISRKIRKWVYLNGSQVAATKTQSNFVQSTQASTQISSCLFVKDQ